MKDKTIKDEMNDIEKILCNVYSRGYDVGHIDGYNKGYDEGMNNDKRYESGLQDAWECARKIYKDLSMDKCIEIFQGESWFDYTASEVIAKIKEYEEKQLTRTKLFEMSIDPEGRNAVEHLMSATKHNIDSQKDCKNCGSNDCRGCISIATGDLTKWTPIIEEQDDEEEYDSETMCGQLYDNDNGLKEQMKSSDNKEDETYVYLYNGTFSKVKKGNSVILSTDITYWDRNIHDDKVLKAGEIHTLKEYFPETGACLITINNYTNKDRCKKCPNDHKCRLCLTGINWNQLDN